MCKTLHSENISVKIPLLYFVFFIILPCFVANKDYRWTFSSGDMFADKQTRSSTVVGLHYITLRTKLIKRRYTESDRSANRVTIGYDTRCCFNVRSKANMSQLNLPHGTDN